MKKESIKTDAAVPDRPEISSFFRRGHFTFDVVCFLETQRPNIRAVSLSKKTLILVRILFLVCGTTVSETGLNKFEQSQVRTLD